MKQLLTLFTTRLFIVHGIQSVNVLCRGIAMLLALVTMYSTNAQIKDYTNYVKLDSIVYPIYPYGHADYKYEYSYDEDGNQIGFVRCFHNNKNLRETYDFSFSSNGDITNYSLESVNKDNVYEPQQYGSFCHNVEGKLIEAFDNAPFFWEARYGLNTTRTFDDLGRPISHSRETEGANDRYSEETKSFKYFDNGRLLEYSWTYQRYYYDIDWINEDIIRVYDEKSEVKYTYDTSVS